MPILGCRVVSYLIWIHVLDLNPQCSGLKELNCVFLQVVKNILELKDEQLAVQMDAQDALWGETGTLFLSVRYICFLTSFYLWVLWNHDNCVFKAHT